MLSRRENMTELRKKPAEDTVELLEAGDRHDDDKETLSGRLSAKEAAAIPLTVRDKKALTLLVVLCKFPHLLVAGFVLRGNPRSS